MEGLFLGLVGLFGAGLGDHFVRCDNPHAKFGYNWTKTAKKVCFLKFLSGRSVGPVCILKKIFNCWFWKHHVRVAFLLKIYGVS